MIYVMLSCHVPNKWASDIIMYAPLWDRFYELFYWSHFLSKEFQMRIPREEVGTLEKHVKRAARAISPQLKVVTCGSYRFIDPPVMSCSLSELLHSGEENLIVVT